MRRANEAVARRCSIVSFRLIGDASDQAEVDQLRHDRAIGFGAKHDVRGFDVAMNKLSITGSDERTGNLQRDLDRGRTIEWAIMANPLFNGFAIDEFHRVKAFVPLAPK